jgi:nucleoside-diphosphate-sugar epimerase
MRALIVGCGYVGLEVGRELVRQGHQVCGLRRNDRAASALRDAGLVPVTADITVPETLNTIPAEYDWVVCCVSATGGGPARYREVYVNGLGNLVAWLAVRPLQRFVYTSSTSVYGQTDGAVVDETSPTEPAEETAQILLEAEHLLLAAASEREFPAVILRVAGIYGPGRGYWLKQFLSGAARLEGRGERVLNMVHRDDVVGGVLAALQLGRQGEIYNLVDDEPVTQLACFEWLSEKLDRSLPPRAPLREAEHGKRGLTSKRVSNRKLKTQLQYRFKYPAFREGFASEWERDSTESS